MFTQFIHFIIVVNLIQDSVFQCFLYLLHCRNFSFVNLISCFIFLTSLQQQIIRFHQNMLVKPKEILKNLQKCSLFLDQRLNCKCEKQNQHEQLIQSLKIRRSDFKTYSCLYEHFSNPQCCLMMHMLAYHKSIQKILMYFRRKELIIKEGVCPAEKLYQELQRMKMQNAKHLKCCQNVSIKIPIYYYLKQKNHLPEQIIKLVLELIRLNEQYPCIIAYKLNNSLQEPVDVQIIIKDLIFLLNTRGGSLILFYDKKKNSILIPTLSFVNSRLRTIFNQKIASCNKQNIKFDHYFRVIDASRVGMFVVKVKVPEKERAIYLMKQKQYVQKEAIWIQSLNSIGDRQKIGPYQMYRYIQNAAYYSRMVSISANVSNFYAYFNSLSSNFKDILSIEGLYFYFVCGNYNPLDYQKQIKAKLNLDQQIFFNFSKFHQFDVKESHIHKALFVSRKNLSIHNEISLHLITEKSIDFTVMKVTNCIQIHLDNSNVNLTPIIESIMEYRSASKQKVDFNYQIQPRGHQKTIVKIKFTNQRHALMVLANYSSTKSYQARAKRYTFYEDSKDQSLSKYA